MSELESVGRSEFPPRWARLASIMIKLDLSPSCGRWMIHLAPFDMNSFAFAPHFWPIEFLIDTRTEASSLDRSFRAAGSGTPLRPSAGLARGSSSLSLSLSWSSQSGVEPPAEGGERRARNR